MTKLSTNTALLLNGDMGRELRFHRLLKLRADLNPVKYANYVTNWLTAGATAIGGCCGTRPTHIADLHQLLDSNR